jgi:hypothetical protein
VKRRHIYEMFKELVESMYRDGDDGQPDLTQADNKTDQRKLAFG